MNEARQMHDHLVNAMLPIIPRTVYQDRRRLNTLVWAIVGLCLTQTVHFSAWAEVTQSRAKSAASGERRFSRWLHHPAIVPVQWYRPVLQAALVDWPLDSRLYVALDTTALTPFVLIRASLVYRGRAISIAWRVLRHRSTQVSFEARPSRARPGACHHADRPGNHPACRSRRMSHERLLHYLHRHRWHGSLAAARQHPGPSLPPICRRRKPISVPLQARRASSRRCRF